MGFKVDAVELVKKNLDILKSKITEDDKFIVKETKSSLFIREKDNSKPNKNKLKLDESEEKPTKEIKYTRISLFDED